MAGSRMIGIFIILLLTLSSSDGLGIDSISVDENTPTYISVSWSTDAGSSWNHYMVDIVAPSGHSLTGYPINTTDTSYQITGLRPEVEYTITVIPWSGSGAGDALNTTVSTEAIAEGEILVYDVTSSSAHIQWRAVEGVLFYRIVTEPSDAIGSLGGIFEEEVGLTILLPGTVFNLTVQNGQSFLNLASTQIRSAPEGPVNVTLDQIGSTEATISWTPPTTPRDAYEVYVIKNSTNERLLAATIRPEDVNECTVNGLSRDWVYRFEVGTLLDASNSFALQRSDMNSNPSVLGRTAPKSPVNVTLDQIGSTEATISWTPPTTPRDAYEVYVIKNSTNERLLAATIRPEDVIECTVNGLSRDLVYRFEVGTLLDASNSFALQRSDMNSNPSVLGRTEAIADGEILVSNVTTSSAFIQWKPRDGLSSYTIVAVPQSAIEPLADLVESSTKLAILLSGTVFTVTVRGGNPVTDLVSTQIRSGE
ncbi:fibronectin-like [Lytechinus variegatus]|uniref:fibronectin-like n=1 Tax=Lytechinus variegatus TaxID=7654 RepID=UPI001BB1E189|nr:fibronectin-like [Lytechinus variegatus]